MSWMGQIGGLLRQYTSGAVSPEQAENHYDQVSGAAPSSTVAGGLADAIRSDQTPPFAQLAAQLFGNSNGEQKASVLTELLATAGPMLPQALGNSAAGGLLSKLLASGQPVTPQAAEEVSPEAMQQLAQHANNQDPSVIDRVSSIYSAHPALVKTLGAGVLSVVLAKIAERTRA